MYYRKKPGRYVFTILVMLLLLLEGCGAKRELQKAKDVSVLTMNAFIQKLMEASPQWAAKKRTACIFDLIKSYDIVALQEVNDDSVTQDLIRLWHSQKKQKLKNKHLTGKTPVRPDGPAEYGEGKIPQRCVCSIWASG